MRKRSRIASAMMNLASFNVDPRHQEPWIVDQFASSGGDDGHSYKPDFRSRWSCVHLTLLLVEHESLQQLLWTDAKTLVPIRLKAPLRGYVHFCSINVLLFYLSLSVKV